MWAYRSVAHRFCDLLFDVWISRFVWVGSFGPLGSTYGSDQNNLCSTVSSLSSPLARSLARVSAGAATDAGCRHPHPPGHLGLPWLSAPMLLPDALPSDARGAARLLLSTAAGPPLPSVRPSGHPTPARLLLRPVTCPPQPSIRPSNSCFSCRLSGGRSRAASCLVT